VTPTSVEALYQAGLEGLASGDVSSALMAAEALSVQDANANFRLVLEAGIDMRMGKLPQAAMKLVTPMQVPETAKIAHVMSGEVLYKSRQTLAAIEVLKKAIELDSGAIDAHRWLAMSYYDLGATGPAVKELAVVSKLAPDHPLPYRLTGLIYKEMEAYDAAIEQYQSALRVTGDFPERGAVQRELAECLLNVGKHEALEEVLEELPLTPQTLTFAAQSHHVRGDAARAQLRIDQALEMDAKFLPALLLKATIQAAQSKLDEATATLQAAVQLHPFDRRLYDQLWQVYTRLDDEAAAQKNADEAARLRDLKTRYTELRAQVSEDLVNADLRYQLGIRAKQLGMFELAASWFSAAVTLNPQHELAATELDTILNGSNGVAENQGVNEGQGTPAPNESAGPASHAGPARNVEEPTKQGERSE
jgi:tetratricopeptide (TPR) repeat protein